MNIFRYKQLLHILFILFSVVLIGFVLFIPPYIYGDGWEYLGMTISFSNHLSPNLTSEDIEERRILAEKSNLYLLESMEYAGYFESINGDYYSYHFWFYSFICTIPYLFLKTIGINPVKVFQFTNAMLLLFLCGWLLYKTSLSNREKLWVFLVTIINPIVFYIPWSHPEVFSFVFLFIGLLELMEGRKVSSSIFISIASLQNQAIAIISIGIILWELMKTKRINLQILRLCLSSGIIFIPYVFYWIYFREFSLITATGYASAKHISLDKILSLFIDPNFGLVVYIPVLCVVLVWLLIHRDKKSYVWAGVLLLMATICSTQFNWNSGMMYIHRYAVWLIPVLIIATYGYVSGLNKKKFLTILTAHLVTTGSVLFFGLLNYKDGQSNHVRFSPLAKMIISIAPSIYNPPYEVFTERALGAEVASFSDELPLTVWNSQGARKSLVIDRETGLMGYLNGKFMFSGGPNLYTTQRYMAGEDIFEQDQIASFVYGWYGLEQNSVVRWRWMAQESSLLLASLNTSSRTIKLTLSSFYKPRNILIYFNGEKVYEGNIGIEPEDVTFEANFVSGMNEMKIASVERGDAPKDLPELNNPDGRILTFSVSSFSIH